MGSGSAIVGYSAAGAQRVLIEAHSRWKSSLLGSAGSFEGADGNFDVETQQKLDKLKAMSPTELAGAEGQALAADVRSVLQHVAHHGQDSKLC